MKSRWPTATIRAWRLMVATQQSTLVPAQRSAAIYQLAPSIVWVADGAIDRVDFIKMDIEGSELRALIGAESALRRWRPKLALSLYHRPKAFFHSVLDSCAWAEMNVAIMQPYFLPYIGYFQLIESVDLFIVYDNVRYTKKGWINRNRMLCKGSGVLFSLPLRHGPDASDVRDRHLAGDFDRSVLLNRMQEMYRKAPCFESALPSITSIVKNADDNLFRFVYQSIIGVCNYLEIETKLVVSSEIAIDHGLKGQDKVIALCREVGAETYVNPIGGTELYSRDDFASNGLQLKFLQPRPFLYAQFEQPFVPWLSILDVMMFNAVSTIRRCLELNFDLV